MSFITEIPKVTKTLIILNIIMYLITPYIPEKDLYSMVGFGITSEHFNIIQPITSIFLHGDFIHLFFNMLMLWMFGKTLEVEMGHRKYLIFYLLSGLGAFLLQGFMFPDNPAIGASGAVFGLMMGMTTLFPNKQVNILFLPFLKVKLKWLLGVCFLFEVIQSFRVIGDGIAHWAHVGGGLTGILLIGFWFTDRFSEKIKSIKK